MGLRDGKGQWIVARVFALFAGQQTRPGGQIGPVEGIPLRSDLQKHRVDVESLEAVQQSGKGGFLGLHRRRFRRPIQIGDPDRTEFPGRIGGESGRESGLGHVEDEMPVPGGDGKGPHEIRQGVGIGDGHGQCLLPAFRTGWRHYPLADHHLSLHRVAGDNVADSGQVVLGSGHR